MLRLGGEETITMVKCVVSGCPNRMVNVSRGLFNRPKKRFFNFPQDPARVQVGSKNFESYNIFTSYMFE